MKFAERPSELNEVCNRLIETAYNASIGLLPKIYAQDSKVMTEEERREDIRQTVKLIKSCLASIRENSKVRS